MPEGIYEHFEVCFLILEDSQLNIFILIQIDRLG